LIITEQSQIKVANRFQDLNEKYTEQKNTIEELKKKETESDNLKIKMDNLMIERDNLLTVIGFYFKYYYYTPCTHHHLFLRKIPPFKNYTKFCLFLVYQRKLPLN
jgi:hypothetical protein